MTPRSRRRRTRGRGVRRGAAALLVLLCLSFATVVGTLLLQAGLAERKYTSRLELAYQADWLVEAGIDRAVVRLGRSAGYTGETWGVASTRLEGTRDAFVRIDVKRDIDPGRRVIHVTARIQGGGNMAIEAAKEIRAAVASSKESH